MILTKLNYVDIYFYIATVLKLASLNTVEPRLSGLVGTSVNSPDNRVSG